MVLNCDEIRPRGSNIDTKKSKILGIHQSFFDRILLSNYYNFCLPTVPKKPAALSRLSEILNLKMLVLLQKSNLDVRLYMKEENYYNIAAVTK